MEGEVINPRLTAALAYAARGWAVLPLWWPTDKSKPCACSAAKCGSPGKHPVASLVPRGLRQAGTDPVAIRHWWGIHPQANVGIRTGLVNGLIVLDVDGPTGADSIRALVAEHGRFSAWWVRTGSGGWHAYLRHPGHGISNSTGKLGSKIDVRGDGGYVVAPPSLHTSGGRYSWIRVGGTLPPMADWLVELLAPRPAPRREVQITPGPGLSPYVATAIEREARAVAAAYDGQRNQRLNLAAWRLGQLVGGGLVAEATVAHLLILAGKEAGLPGREAEATVRSGLRAGRSKPRDVRRG